MTNIKYILKSVCVLKAVSIMSNAFFCNAENTHSTIYRTTVTRTILNLVSITGKTNSSYLFTAVCGYILHANT